VAGLEQIGLPDAVEQWPLNPEQRRAVQLTEGPVRIIAGPGSGKTRLLVYRIAYILKQRLASPHSVFTVTFTRKAAGEIRSRVDSLLQASDIEAGDLPISTFHSLAYGIVRAEAEWLGFNPGQLRVCPLAQARRLLRQAMVEAGLDGRWDAALIARCIERAKDRLVAPAEYVQVPGDLMEEAVARVYARYQALLKDRNLVDYADLLPAAVQVVTRNEAARAFYPELCRYLMVDEFQDTSTGQYRLMQALAARHHNVCVIGDPMQSIYRWRGADPDNLLRRFSEDYPDAREVTLTETHRSTQTILKAAGAVVQVLGLGERRLTTTQGPGEPLRVLRSESEQDEALRIAREVERLAQSGQAQARDCAVLVRTRAQQRLMEQAFLRAGVAYQLVGERPFFRRPEVRTMLGYLQLAMDPFDAGALAAVINTPPRGLGRAALQKLRGDELQLTTECLLAAEGRSELAPTVRQAVAQVLALINELADAARRLPLPELFDRALERSGYRAYLAGQVPDEAAGGDEEAPAGDSPEEESLAELRRMALNYAGEDGLSRFLADMELRSDDLAVIEDGAQLATLHAVKGLEFPVVFLAGMAEGVFPHARCLEERGQLAEEYRLFYVGLTRAQRQVYLSYARYRENRGQVQEMAPSRFLKCLPRELLERC
jgi:DNA helicase-2/ATP-dependent DNA helicase PcrA